MKDNTIGKFNSYINKLIYPIKEHFGEKNEREIKLTLDEVKKLAYQ